MIEIEYAPAFLRQFKKLPNDLQEEASEKITLFKGRNNHSRLKVHKLKGDLVGKWSFSVNYSYRIVFKWLADNIAGLVAIGDHDIYK